MAFTLPDFNLTVDVYTGPWLTKTLRLSTLANLALSRRVLQIQGGFDPSSAVETLTPLMTLLLPAGTDVRDRFQGGPYDLVDAPAGSGRWYVVAGVDDIGKGFPNEHRVALLAKVGASLDGTEFAGLVWPVPMP